MTVVHPNHIVGINSITVQTGDSLSVHKADGSLIRTIVSNTGVSTFHAIEVSKGGGDLTVGVSTFFVDNSAGRVGINTNVPAQELDVRGDQPSIYIKHTGATNTQNALYLEVKNDACEFNSYQEVTATRRPFIFKQYTDTRAVIDASGRLLINHTASVDQNAQIQSWTSGTDTFAGFKYGNNASPNIIRLGKTRNGSAGGATIVQEDDEVGRLLFQGNNGTDFKDCAAVQCYVDGEPGSSGDATDMPGRLILSTAADGASSLSERVRITSAGNTRITKANDGVVSGALQINTTLANYGTIVVRDYNQANIGALQVENNTSGAGQNNKVIRSVDLGSSNWAHAGYHALSHKFRISGETDSNNVLQIHSTGISPGADGTLNLGSPSARWANIYSADLQLSNEGSENEIDGSWGSYTIQEGETDLFLINRRNGKKYTFNLTEVS